MAQSVWTVAVGHPVTGDSYRDSASELPGAWLGEPRECHPGPRSKRDLLNAMSIERDCENMISQPQPVTDVILEAVAATQSSEGDGWSNALVEAYLDE